MILKPEYRTIKGKRMILLPEADFQELVKKAGEYGAVTQARSSIHRTRRILGLSQAELARRAGIRPETLNRIEQGRNKPSVPTIAKIERALKAEQERQDRIDTEIAKKSLKEIKENPKTLISGRELKDELARLLR